MELRSGEYSGMEPSPWWRVPFAAAAALCWKSVINMAAVSRSSIPSLLASSCSNVPGSNEMDGLLGVVVEDAVFGPLFLRVSGWRRSPSLAWTVRSWRSRRSRRTKVDLHLAHLKGRSLVSRQQQSQSRGQEGGHMLMKGRRGEVHLPHVETTKNHIRLNLNGLTRSFVSTSMFTPAERPVAVLALVLLFGRCALLDGRGGGRFRGRDGRRVGLSHDWQRSHS